MADPSMSSDEEPTKADAPATPPRVDSKAFTNTKQHVADRQGDGDVTERFSNTKLNIALINDPKNGPRFTMTKREAGLLEGEKAVLSPNEDGETSSGNEKAANDVKEATTADGPVERPKASSLESISNTQSTPIVKSAQLPEATESSGSTPRTQPGPNQELASAAEPGQGPEPAGNQTPEGGTADKDSQGKETASPAPEPPLPGQSLESAAPQKVPVDSSKTFVGPNGTYYDESWRWMDWRGTRQSWNWPAALSFGHWFAYRRLHLFAGLYLAWLAGLAAAVANGLPLTAVLAVALIVTGLTGVYGNTLYFFAFRRAVSHVTEKGEGSYDDRKSQLAAAGGIDGRAPWVMAVMTAISIAAAFGATIYARGGLSINLWPF